MTFGSFIFTMLGLGGFIAICCMGRYASENGYTFGQVFWHCFWWLARICAIVLIGCPIFAALPPIFTTLLYIVAGLILAHAVADFKARSSADD